MAEPGGAVGQHLDPEMDRRLMAAALGIGRRNLGRTFPNPAVGALVVRDEAAGPRIIGRGWTGTGGRPHAETIALEQAGEAARGATLYVTLEPCNHTGRTPPCVEAIVASGVGRVVSAMADPDPRVAGRGHAALAEAGIPVTTDVLADAARRAHIGHTTRINQGRPQVTLKLAVSADGMIGRKAGERMIISGPEAFAEVHTMRAEADAVMIGIGTVGTDDPLLTVRLPGMADRSPIRIILDSMAQIKVRSRLVASIEQAPLWVVVGPDATENSRKNLVEAGAEVIEAEAGSGGVALASALPLLAKRGLTRILAEGGGKVAASLVTGGFVDEVVLFRASVVVGPNGVRALAGQALSAIERSPRYRLVEDAVRGEDRKLRYVRAD